MKELIVNIKENSTVYLFYNRHYSNWSINGDFFLGGDIFLYHHNYINDANKSVFSVKYYGIWFRNKFWTFWDCNWASIRKYYICG